MKVALRLAEGDLPSLAEQMSRWLDRVLGPEYQRYRTRDTWQPSINLYEDPLAFYVVADLAGIKAESIDLRVEKGKLLLRGERGSPRPQPAGNPPGRLRMHLMEIDHGPFLRALQLPEDIDDGRIEACYRNGFLWVKMPKSS